MKLKIYNNNKLFLDFSYYYAQHKNYLFNKI